MEPIIVRVLGFGDRYEILSGHRRAAAQRMNGEVEIEARIAKVSDVEAASIVINSNLLQRDKILPSERARSYMLRNEYLKKEKYGGQSHGGTQPDVDLKDILAKEFNDSKSSIFRYIRLNYLIDDILELVDKGMIRLTLAVDLSYFSKQRQAVIYKYFFADKKAALNADAIKRMKEYGNREVFDQDNKSWKMIPNAIKGRVVKDDEQFRLDIGLFSKISEIPSCHIYVIPHRQLSDFMYYLSKDLL